MKSKRVIRDIEQGQYLLDVKARKAVIKNKARCLGQGLSFEVKRH